MANNTHGDLHSGGVMLAETENISVFQCSCGNVHLQIGAVCLTMQPEELAELNAALRCAMAQRAQTATAAASIN